ncbi:MAG: hypothetical protein OEZ36_02190, partial [Spirochaetota bacterium]|nr:hypothetical protein [Spirochaetota bacterium]
MKKTMLFGMILFMVSALSYEANGLKLKPAKYIYFKKESNTLDFEGFELRLELKRVIRTMLYGDKSVRKTIEYARFIIKWRDGYHLLRENSFIRPKGGMSYPFEVFEVDRDNVNRYVSVDIGEIG